MACVESKKRVCVRGFQSVWMTKQEYNPLMVMSLAQRLSLYNPPPPPLFFFFLARGPLHYLTTRRQTGCCFGPDQRIASSGASPAFLVASDYLGWCADRCGLVRDQPALSLINRRGRQLIIGLICVKEAGQNALSLHRQ